MVYIRQSQLPKLKEYKYSGVDRSLISRYVLKPYWWNSVIKLMPMSMAPNAITLTGFGFVIVNILTMLYYTPGLDTDCPSWVYASWSIGLFLYQTFDAIDGSQARRTHQSGPLGELFDHGVDALNTSLEVLLFAATMNFGQGWKTILVLFASLFTFYVQTWDEYHTHTLTLGLVSGPVEGILTLAIVYAITAVKGGGSYWQQPMLQALGVPKLDLIPDLAYRMDFGEFYLAYGGLVLLFNTGESILNVLQARRERKENPAHALLGLLPFAFIWTVIPTYLYLQPAILREHLVPFVFFVGLVNAYSVGQMITAHLTKSSFPYQNILILPLLFGIADSAGPVLQQHFGFGWPSALGDNGYQVAFMFSSLGLAIGVYGSFVVDVIVNICDYLDIWCLTIKHPYNETMELRDGKKSDTLLLVALAFKDFFFKQRQPDNALKIKLKAVSVDDIMAQGSAVDQPLNLAPESVKTNGLSNGASKASRFDPNFTDNVIRATGPKAHKRLAQVMPSLLRHLHDFCRENEITVDEWMAAVQMLNAAGQMSDEKRNEGQLVCDVLGIESLVDEITYTLASEAKDAPTATAILGPFWRADAPLRKMGDTIVFGIDDGDNTLMHGRVLDFSTGEPIKDAIVDVWHTAPNGLYEQQDPNQPDMNLRGRFTTGKDGEYSFYCLRPTSYPIPNDGPAGKLLELLDRHPMRPAHIHFILTAPGYKPLVTQIFDRNDKHIHDDSVFAVKDSLIVDFVPKQGDPKAQFDLSYDFKLARFEEHATSDAQPTAQAATEGL